MHTAQMESPKLQSVESTQKSEDVEYLGDSTKITSGNGWIAQWQTACESCRTRSVGGGRWRLRCVARTATLGDESSEEEVTGKTVSNTLLCFDTNHDLRLFAALSVNISSEYFLILYSVFCLVFCL